MKQEAPKIRVEFQVGESVRVVDGPFTDFHGKVDEINPENGKPFSCSKKYTASLNEKATLRHDLESWRGRAFTQEELKGFDLEKVIGVNAQVMVMHNTKDGKTYANVATVTPLGKGQAKIAGSKDYVRKKDRKAASVQQAADEFQATDEDVPF
jgi:hypothetical protein